MGNAVKLGDSDTGHVSHPPTPVAVGSSTVKVDGMPLARQGVQRLSAGCASVRAGRAATPPVGAISLIPYSFIRRRGKDDAWPKKAVYVEVVMSRVVEGEYSRIPLHMMVEAGRAVGVPFKNWDPTVSTLSLESGAIKLPAVNLTKLDENWALAATEQGVIKNLSQQLPTAVYRALRRDYVHRSASNQGISSPAGTHKQETTVSKERRHIIGNQEA